MKTIRIIKEEKGFNWANNDDGLNCHKACIIAIYAEQPIGSPKWWLIRHDLYRPDRLSAIERLDRGEGLPRDIEVIRELAGILNMGMSAELG